MHRQLPEQRLPESLSTPICLGMYPIHTRSSWLPPITCCRPPTLTDTTSAAGHAGAHLVRASAQCRRGCRDVQDAAVDLPAAARRDALHRGYPLPCACVCVLCSLYGMHESGCVFPVVVGREHGPVHSTEDILYHVFASVFCVLPVFCVLCSRGFPLGRVVCGHGFSLQNYAVRFPNAQQCSWVEGSRASSLTTPPRLLTVGTRPQIPHRSDLMRQGQQCRLHFFEYEGFTVWGLTAAVLIQVYGL